jgi:hypothetical protein
MKAFPVDMTVRAYKNLVVTSFKTAIDRLGFEKDTVMKGEALPKDYHGC